MPYADTDFWLALMKGDDWLAEPAERLLDAHLDELRVSLTTFIELFLIEERFEFDRDVAASAILSLADGDVSESVIFGASEYIARGANVFDAFHAAAAEKAIISSDSVYGDLGLVRIPLEGE